MLLYGDILLNNWFCWYCLLILFPMLTRNWENQFCRSSAVGILNMTAYEHFRCKIKPLHSQIIWNFLQVRVFDRMLRLTARFVSQHLNGCVRSLAGVCWNRNKLQLFQPWRWEDGEFICQDTRHTRLCRGWGVCSESPLIPSRFFFTQHLLSRKFRLACCHWWRRRHVTYGPWMQPLHLLTKKPRLTSEFHIFHAHMHTSNYPRTHWPCLSYCDYLEKTKMSKWH